MTKVQASKIKLGTNLRSRSTGIGETFVVSDIRQTGPRPPYFRLGDQWVTYRDCAHASYRMTTYREGTALTYEERAERKRARDRAYSAAKRKAAG